jgi:hypothetical protein
MTTRWLLAVLVLLVMAGGAVADTWQSDTGIVGGLGDAGSDSKLTVFQMSSTWYLISGNSDGAFIGYNWTGSAWQSDTGIVSGLDGGGWPDFFNTAPIVFYMDTTWYLTSGGHAGKFQGYNWTGSAWQSDTGIVSGLGDIGSSSTPTTFQIDTTWYTISGKSNGNMVGYNWTGSAWQSDTGIVSGLSQSYELHSRPIAFSKGGTRYLIVGYGNPGEEPPAGGGTFVGYDWTGSTWQSNSAIVSGLGDIGDYSAPTVFNSDRWYLISGKTDGTFVGFNASGDVAAPTPVNLQNTTGNFWVNHTWLAGSGDITDSYNVSINGTWYNGTTNTYYNNTLTTYADWSNTTVYAYNNTAGLSDGSVSEDVQLPYPIPAVPAGAGSTWDYYWVNHSWTAGSSYGIWCGDTDSYNVSINGTWYNGTTNTYYNNTGLSPHAWSNASIYAFNNTAGINETYIYQNVQMANRAITITNTSDWSGWEGVNVYVDYDATDPDGDTPTFSCNRTDLFTDFSWRSQDTHQHHPHPRTLRTVLDVIG